ncbi:hypothetical protein N7449_003925 [Penicillium cf. viridicatum]|uniref:Uncharacterized protein n=1 Tax=Penicillium cf. viridicatum TaxID=2972119 RepID=A0A9W9MXU0_9EURO|nr:hypothetical protein N7449_003925 [Penicillium cf. viridicatum]
MAPPGIEPGLTQIKTTTMCRHTTRPWHLLDMRISFLESSAKKRNGATRNRTGANTDLNNHNVSSYH